ncbi:restriction endonuclease subunit S [Bradyrhizobium sp. CCBAU 25338]|uniref:restriction endonuclease subunit S n=1 Tax=Bradyrhizobium sp. CCBAU 25338 TaxID=1641877 RepID=UPI002302A79B|nr:restriction endonuclease subunit S [Bradyrhizobium sp. CCBAU 25338]
MSMHMQPVGRLLELSDSGVWAGDDPVGGVSILRSTNFGEGGEIDYSNLAIKAVPEKERVRKALRPGDILIEKSGGGPKQPVGRVAYFRGEERAHVFGNFIARLRTRPEVCEPRYLFWFLFRAYENGVTEAFQKQTTGIRNLELKRYLDVGIPLPPLEEQRRIVKLLDRAAEIRRRADVARAKMRAIVPALFLDTFGDPATNPKGWPRRPLGELIGKIVGGKNIEAGNGSSAYRILKVSAVTSGYFQPEEAKPAPDGYQPPPEHHIRKGDFLFSRANTRALVGAVAIVENDNTTGLLLPDKIWRIEWRQETIEPRFAYSLLRSNEVRRIFAQVASGTSDSMKNISQRKLASIEVPVPSLPLQRTFAEQAKSLEATARALDAAAAKAAAIAAALSAEVFG